MDTDDPLPGLGLTPTRPGDGALLHAFLQHVEEPLSDYTLTNTLMWAGPFRPYWRLIENCFCQFALTDGALTMLRPPFGPGDLAAAIDESLEICREHNAAFGKRGSACVEYVNEAFLRRYPLPGWTREPNSGDYLYDTARMVSLEGGDLSSKRQMRNRFARRYVARTEPYTPELRPACLRVLETWNRQVGEWADQQGESADRKRADDVVACTYAIDHYRELGLTGMVLFADDQPAGFTFGEPLGPDSFSVVIEKCDREFTGSANYIFSEFSRQFGVDYRFCNAGDDWGIENLARVKESYRPVGRLFKFTLIPPVPVRVAVPAIDLFTADRPQPACEVAADTRGEAAELACPLAGRGDLDALWRLEHESFDDDDKFNRRQLRYLLGCPRASTHLVRVDGKVVASAVLLRRRTRIGVVGRLYSLCVASAHRGKGLGRLLLGDVIAACRREGISRLRLEVRADNTPAIALYSKAGFVVEDHLAEYYGPMADGLKMRLDLTSAAVELQQVSA